ncbi:MAG: Y-family DNA polymerase [Burkholderiaceae bacterium]|nr:Y-family DNA polymerase [Burkholderiaceae bacterium]
MLALVDVNNMYVSCERVFRPALLGRPVVVLSHNDGICIARSNEAKDLGVQMAQPWFQVRHLQRRAGLLALSANFELYGDMSNRMMTLAAAHAPRQEIYSIDECFLDFAGVRGDLSEQGRRLRAQVLQWTGLPTSVGFAATKTLAKLANHVAKTAERKPGIYARGLAQVCNFAELPAAALEAVLRATDVGAVWGIGRRTGARLHQGGVHSVFELMHADPVLLRRQFNVVLERTVRELRGEPCFGVDDAPAANQQIMCSRSFGEPVMDLARLTESVNAFASRVAQKLRSQRSVAGAVQVFLSTSPFRRQDRQHSPSVTLALRPPTADTRLLAAAATRALHGMFRPEHRYVKAGVVLVDLQPQAPGANEPDLFADDDTPQPVPRRDRTRLMIAVDALNQRFGRGAIDVASAARRSHRAPSVGAPGLRSPRCTTRLDEVIRVRA